MVIKGESPVFEDVLAAEVERDRRDTDRAVAPLKQADDAILVDSTGLDAQGVIDLMIDQIRQRAPRFFDAQEL
jgi:cytidylate kinase